MTAGNLGLKQHNAAIDIFRYICALLVLAIHTHPFMELDATLGFVFTHMITRIGVPFFFGVSGYFFTSKLEAGKTALWPYIKRLLLVYGLWTAFYYALDFVQFGRYDLPGFLGKCIIGFIVTGSRGHFWFFPALIYAACFVTLLWRLGLKKLVLPLGIILYAVGAVGVSYCGLMPQLKTLFRWEHWQTVRRIFFIGFPFFGCGYLVKRLQQYIRKPKTTTLLWGISAVLWLGEIALVKIMNWQWDVATTPFLYVFLATTLLYLLTHPMPQYARQSNCCRVLANFTYYSHPALILGIRFVWRGIPETPLFLLAAVLCGILGFGIYKWNNKYLNYLV